jgi:pimeloyl-ACP methyl ester carboxylesterase
MGKDNLILIHGALGNGKELEPIAHELSRHYATHIYEIPGHGQRKNELALFDLEKIIEDFKLFLDTIGSSYVFGFSLGGYLALCAAQESNKNIRAVVTLGTKFDWSPAIANQEVKALDLHFLQTKAEGFYTYLLDLHQTHLPQLLVATAAFMKKLGEAPILSPKSVKHVRIPVRIVRGGKDKMVSAKESNSIAVNISNGRYFEIPHFIHPIGFLKPEVVAKTIGVQLLSCSYTFLTVGEKKIACKIDNNKGPFRLLFLHEALGSIAQWRDFPEQLGNVMGLPTTSLEMQGYGFSSENNMPRHADYLHAFAWNELPNSITAIAPQEKLILVGHSDGGSIALLYAAKFPEKIAGVVTLAAHICNEKETRIGIPPAIEAYEAGKLKGLEVFHGSKTEKLFYDWANTWLADFFHDWNIEKDIKGIAVPGLIIQGDKDQYGTAAQVTKISACFAAPATQLLVPNCGHAPHHEQRDIVISEILKWYHTHFAHE